MDLNAFIRKQESLKVNYAYNLRSYKNSKTKPKGCSGKKMIVVKAENESDFLYPFF